jgi:ubiquinone/menaquinone biosynthesis C-methylase UbiE
MKRTLLIVALCAAPWVLPVAAQTAHQHHPPQSTEEYARVLEDPERDGWQKPHEVIMALKLSGQETLADIGSGTGYFANRLARHAQRVFAVDVDAKLLELSLKAAPANVTPVLASPDNPRLPEGANDLIFFCDVVHHIENRAAYLAKVRRALKPGGRVAVIDFQQGKLKIGPPPEMKISREEMVREFEKAGFRLIEEQRFLPYQYFVVFSPVP